MSSSELVEIAKILGLDVCSPEVSFSLVLKKQDDVHYNVVTNDGRMILVCVDGNSLRDINPVFSIGHHGNVNDDRPIWRSYERFVFEILATD
jgi:hypothetical protein